MPPQTPLPTSEQKCPWYQPLCRVTPLSKYLALVIFIALPFIGGYIGYKVAPERIIEVQVPVVTQVKSESSPEVLATIPSDIQHFLFEGKRTGYFIFHEKVYFSNVQQGSAENNYDWVEFGPATLLPNADASTFRIIASEPAQVGSLFAVDAHSAYAGTTTLENVDVATAVTLGKGGAFLLSDKGLYIGNLFLAAGTKSDLEIFILNPADGEGASPYNAYVHNIKTDVWTHDGKVVPAPKASELTLDTKLYPSDVVITSCGKGIQSSEVSLESQLKAITSKIPSAQAVMVNELNGNQSRDVSLYDAKETAAASTGFHCALSDGSMAVTAFYRLGEADYAAMMRIKNGALVQFSHAIANDSFVNASKDSHINTNPTYVQFIPYVGSCDYIQFDLDSFSFNSISGEKCSGE